MATATKAKVASNGNGRAPSRRPDPRDPATKAARAVVKHYGAIADEFHAGKSVEWDTLTPEQQGKLAKAAARAIG